MLEIAIDPANGFVNKHKKKQDFISPVLQNKTFGVDELTPIEEAKDSLRFMLTPIKETKAVAKIIRLICKINFAQNDIFFPNNFFLLATAFVSFISVSIKRELSFASSIGCSSSTPNLYLFFLHFPLFNKWINPLVKSEQKLERFSKSEEKRGNCRKNQ